MAVSKRSARSKSKSKGNAGCLLWLVALSIVFVLVFLNLGRIRETLGNTKFLEVVATKGGRAQPSAPASPVSPAPAVEEPVRLPPAAPSGGRDAVTVGPAGRDAPEGAGTPAESLPSKPEGSPGSAKPVASKTRSASLYFVRIDGDGVITRQEVKRTVPETDSPLTDALQSLLKGPGEEELRKELITLIPQGTKLLSAQVRGSTAYLNFSESFMYNSYGIEGYAGQLKQVVWTATAFPSVQDVQILVEGQRRDFLGGEGVYIGRPLSRNSF